MVGMVPGTITEPGQQLGVFYARSSEIAGRGGGEGKCPGGQK